ncbi:hypothetical protein [Martelella alba]|uniref:hypothetical protein n=1 Tax=Martelella alba TaxID=2590451 RepID=UPI001E29145E|nr:hypothetical protein [Martelella alba]
MKDDKSTSRTFNSEESWVTIKEAIGIIKKELNVSITPGDIYRSALSGIIFLSIYFQSPVILKKVKITNQKIKLFPINQSLLNRLCFLEKKCFINNRNLIISTEGNYTSPKQMIFDTALRGYEYVLVQRLLARSLNLPLPVIGAKEINYGISVNFFESTFQLYEKVTKNERIKQQIKKLPKDIAKELIKCIPGQLQNNCYQNDYFPVHDLPQDACFVIRQTELQKLIIMFFKKNCFINFNSNIYPFISTILAFL